MAKQGMKRSNVTHTQERNEQAAVPEIQGKAKHGNEKAKPIIAGTSAPHQKVYHHRPTKERPISEFYSAIDTDLGRDNAENDLSAADLQNL